MGQNTTNVTDADFAAMIASGTPTLVDFWAEWCGPCKMMDGPLDELAGENTGKLTVAKLNVDEAQEIARRFEVMSIPTMILFKDGEEAKRIIGAKPKQAIIDDFAEFL